MNWHDYDDCMRISPSVEVLHCLFIVDSRIISNMISNSTNNNMAMMTWANTDLLTLATAKLCGAKQRVN